MINLQPVWEAFENAWYSESPVRLTADQLCERFADHPNWHAQIRREYPSHWLDCRWSDIRLEIENAARNQRFIDWSELIGLDQELEPRAREHFRQCGGKEDNEILAETASLLNSRDYQGSRDEHLKQHKPILRDIELLRVVGSGGFGMVLEAYDRVHDRRVAIKTVLSKHRNVPGAAERLEREALILAKLEHPNILPLYSFLRPDRSEGKRQEPAFVMRLLPESLIRKMPASANPNSITPRVVVRRLRDAIADFHSIHLSWNATSQRRVEFRQLLKQLTDVCHGIAYAHQRKIIHRDIKSVNVVIGPHGETVIIDWGIARILVDEILESEDLSRPATRVEDLGFEMRLDGSGTEPYASPEQWRHHPTLQGEECVRQPTDVYALGAMLWEIINGVAPAKELKHLVRFTAFPAWAPAELKNIVAKATAIDPWERFIGPRELNWYKERKLLSGQPEEGDASSDQLLPNESTAPSPGGVEQFRQSIQNWLDNEAERFVAKPLEEQITGARQAITQTQLELENRQSELAQASGLLEQVSGSLASSNTELVRVHRSLSTTRKWLTLAATILLLTVGGLGYWSGALGKRVHKLLAESDVLLAHRAETEAAAAAAVQDRNLTLLQGALSLADQQRFVEAKSVLAQAKNPGKNFAWNYAQFASENQSPTTLHGDQNGIPSHQGAVLAVATSYDGKNYFSFGQDGRLLTWDARSSVPIRESLVGPQTGRVGMGLNSIEGRVTVSQLPENMPAASSKQFRVNDQILAIGESEDKLVPVEGKKLSQVVSMLAGLPHTDVTVKVVTDGQEPRVVSLRRSSTSSVVKWQWLQRFSSGAKWLAASGQIDDGSIVVWLVDVASGETCKQWQLQETESSFALSSLSFSEDSSRLLIGGSLHEQEASTPFTSQIVDLNSSTFEIIDQQNYKSSPFGFVLNSDGTQAIGAGFTTEFSFETWNIGVNSTRRLAGVRAMIGEDVSTLGLANQFSPDEQYLVMAGLGSPVHVFSSDGNTHLLRINETAPRMAVAFSAQGSLLAIANGITIEIYKTSGWQHMLSFPMDMTYHSNGLQPSLAFTYDGKQLLIGSEAGVQVLWLNRATATVDLGLAHVTAARWTADETLWIAQNRDSDAPGIGIHEIRSDGTLIRTVVSSLPGRHEPAAMSSDGSQVLLARMGTFWGNDGSLESWAVDHEPNRRWSLATPGNAVRPIAVLAEGNAVVEVSSTDFGIFDTTNNPPTLFEVSISGDSLTQIGVPRRMVQRVLASGKSVALTPDPLVSEKRGPVRLPQLSILKTPGGELEFELPIQAAGAVLSDDGRLVAVCVANFSLERERLADLKIFDTRSGEEVASLKGRSIGWPVANAFSFSRDGKRVGLGTTSGEILVWDYVANELVVDLTWKDPTWGKPWVSGATFSPDGTKLFVTAFDFDNFRDPIRIGRNLRLQRGGIAAIDIEHKSRIVHDDAIGIVTLGEPAKDRRRVASTNMITGEVRVWDCTKDSPRQIAIIPDSSTGQLDASWAELASVRSMAISPDGAQIAIVGPVGNAESAVSRLVVLSIEGRRTLRSIDLKNTVADDIAWQGRDLAILTHDVRTMDASPKARLLSLSPKATEASQVAEYVLGNQIRLDMLGAMVVPRFNSTGAQFVLPIASADGMSQSVMVVATATGKELYRPAYTHGESVHAFQWSHDNRIILSTVVKSGTERWISVWDPSSRKLQRFKIEDAPSTNNVQYNTGAFHVDLSPDGMVAAQRSNDSFLQIWSAQDERFVAKIRLPVPTTLRSMQFSPNSQALFLMGNPARAQILRAPPQSNE